MYKLVKQVITFSIAKYFNSNSQYEKIDKLRNCSEVVSIVNDNLILTQL